MISPDSITFIIASCVAYAIFILFKIARYVDALNERIDYLEDRENDLQEVDPEEVSDEVVDEVSNEVVKEVPIEEAVSEVKENADEEKVNQIISLSEEAIKKHMEKYEKILDSVDTIKGKYQGAEKRKKLLEREEMIAQEEHCIRMKHAFFTAFLPNMKYQLETILPLRFKHATKYAHIDYISKGFDGGKDTKDFCEKVEKLF